jgi:hypothetical protein
VSAKKESSNVKRTDRKARRSSGNSWEFEVYAPKLPQFPFQASRKSLVFDQKSDFPDSGVEEEDHDPCHFIDVSTASQPLPVEGGECSFLDVSTVYVPVPADSETSQYSFSSSEDSTMSFTIHHRAS